MVIQQSGGPVDVALVNELEDSRVSSREALVGLSLDVPVEHGLDHLNANGKELLPVDQLLIVFVGKSNQHVDVVLIQPVSQSVKGLLELTISQLAVVVGVNCSEHGLKSTFERGDETRRLDIGGLRLTFLLVHILDLHDVESRHKWVNLLSLGVNEAGKLELGSQVQLSLDFQLLLKKFVDPGLNGHYES